MISDLRDAHLNNFALRCFRDTADGDYISARINYRAELIQQALWASQQAIEKYVKAILLLRRIRSNKPCHFLLELLKKLEKHFPLRLSDDARRFIQYIDLGQDRYLTGAYGTDGIELPALDRTVWELRLFCIIYYRGATPNAEKHAELDTRYIEEALTRPPKRLQPLFPGLLDSILRTPAHPAYKHLVWKNLYFGNGNNKTVELQPTSISVNSPLDNYPEIRAILKEFVHLPGGPQTNTLNSNMSKVLQAELQRRLDFLDQYVDTLETGKKETDDPDISAITEAKHHHQNAREHYHCGDLIAAWRDIQMAEGCVIVGNREVTGNRRLSDEIDRAM